MTISLGGIKEGWIVIQQKNVLEQQENRVAILFVKVTENLVPTFSHISEKLV